MTETRPRTHDTIGGHIRVWRQRRRMSQLDLAFDAEISARHLSFIETGRSLPSRALVLRLAEELQVPQRERNVLLTVAGYAPVFTERPLSDSAFQRVMGAVDSILAGHRPYPAFALDRHWRVIAGNGAAPQLYEGVAARLLEPPINVMRLSLHPEGLAPRIVNYGEWRGHLLGRLRRQVELTADPAAAALLEEVSGYPRPKPEPLRRAAPAAPEVAIALQISSALGVLSFVSTTTVFGSPVDITLSELMLELFFPADEATARILRSLS